MHSNNFRFPHFSGIRFEMFLCLLVDLLVRLSRLTSPYTLAYALVKLVVIDHLAVSRLNIEYLKILQLTFSETVINSGQKLSKWSRPIEIMLI